jgi:enoyl-CoA hydratase/carnithine racemase
MLILGERFTAAEAVQAGIVSHLAAEGSALEKSRELAGRAAKCSHDAVAATKGLLVALESGETDLARWEKIREQILDSPERRESVARARDSTDK